VVDKYLGGAVACFGRGWWQRRKGQRKSLTKFVF
jgi:hypothetical protein